MAKAIKWQIPFASLSGTLYRIDIYAEGYSGDPIQLTAGESPFVTEEDSSEDFFAPIRTQTGSIQVCTRKPDGTMLTLDEILPANNIDHPVRLLNISDPSNHVIEWQGFLSCEAYSQNYTAIPENLTLSVISVLEAMDSVQLDQTRSSGLATIAAATYNALNEIVVQSGMDFFTHIRYSMTSWRIFNKYIDQTVFFERKEYDNENSTTYIVSGLSAKAALDRLCTFMGWTAREQGTQLYLEYIGESIGMYQETFSGFGSNFHPSGTPSAQITSGDIADFDWRGTDHKRDIRQGAKSVAVAAKLEKYDLNISLPEFPAGDITTIYRQLWKYAGDGNWLYLIASRNSNAYSNIQFGFYAADLRYGYFHFNNYGTTTLAQVLTHIAVGTSSSALSTIFGDALTMYRWYAGAFLSRYCWEETDSAQVHDTSDALYCVFFPRSLNFVNNPDPSEQTDFDPSQVGTIFSINNVTDYRCNIGYLRLTADTDTIFMWPSSDYSGSELKHSDAQENDWFIGMELRFGNKWWNGSSWQSSWCTFNARMRKNGFKNNYDATTMPDIQETDGYLIPITGEMQGLVELKIWPMASPTSYSENNTQVLEMMFKSLNVEHIVPEDSELTNRSENHYFRLLGTNFRDEISINAELASMLNNQPSPSLIMDDAATPASSIDYTVSGGTEARRPEVDLLNRLASYYGASRQTLDLITKHPTAAVLPLLKLNGINDGKTYLPLSESRDWRNEECTLKCFEMPGSPSES